MNNTFLFWLRLQWEIKQVNAGCKVRGELDVNSFLPARRSKRLVSQWYGSDQAEMRRPSLLLLGRFWLLHSTSILSTH